MAFEDEVSGHRRWLGTRVARARVVQGYRVKDLAEEVNISESTIRDIERGVISAKWDTICILSDHLQLNLWGWEDSYSPIPIKHPAPAPEVEITRECTVGFLNFLDALQSGSKITIGVEPPK